MAKIVIFGAGDIAQIANYYFEIDSEHEVVAFTVDAQFMQGERFEGKPVVPFERLTEMHPPSEVLLFIATSYRKLNKLREQKYLEAKAKGYQLATYVSSKCTYLSQHPPGDNCFIFEDNTIQPFVRIGSNVILWSGNHIGHHSTIHDHNFVSSHVVISGHCTIEPNCFLGVNATLHHGVVIARESLIGAAAIIAKSTSQGDVFLPARSTRLEKKSHEIDL